MHKKTLVQKSLMAAAVAVVASLLPLAVALAQDGSGDGAQTTFLPYVFAVYTVTWAAFFAYAFYMGRRQRELRRQIEELRQQQGQRQG